MDNGAFLRGGQLVVETGQVKLRAFQIILALVICTEYWIKAFGFWSEQRVDDVISLVAVTLLAGWVVWGRGRRLAFAGIALLQAWYVWSLFPQTGNHRYLELIFATLFALLDDELEEERRLLLRSLRWMVLVVLFWSGVQKLVHGYWLDGQYLAFSLWREPFRQALAPLLGVEELQRLTSFTGAVGDGSYRVSAPLFLVVSNLVWIAEIALAVLLYLPRTRRAAMIAACLVFVATEVVARELMFGVEFLAAILLFDRGDLLRRLVVPTGALLALLILIRLVLPGVTFH